MAKSYSNTLQELLRFAVENTKNEDVPENPRNIQPMDPERREFLEKMFKSMTIDFNAELKKYIATIECPTSSLEKKINALKSIKELVCDLDIANNFLKIGGAKVCLICLQSDDDRIRATIAEIIAEIAQNNPYGQENLTDANVMQELIKYIGKYEDSDVILQGIFAVSCLIRNYEPALKIFIQLNGLHFLMLCLKTNDDRTLKRVTFLISILCSDYSYARDGLIKIGITKELGSLIEPSIKYSAQLESMLSALVDLVNNDEKGKQKLKTMQLSKKLEKIIELQAVQPGCEDTIEFCKKLIKFIE